MQPALKNFNPDYRSLTFVKRSFISYGRQVAACFLLLMLALGCATKKTPPAAPPGHPKPYKVLGKWYQPLPHADGFSQRGIASWYGKDFHGKKTSNGEIYNMHAMTAAHKTLPLGTYVQVTNLTNNLTTQVRINDRGPFVRGRIIDLSYSAARKLEVVGPGTAPVEVVALGTPAAAGSSSKPAGPLLQRDYYTGNFTIQVGAFMDRNNAERLKNKLDQKFTNAHITVYDTGREVFYRVRVGRCSTLEQADEYEAVMIREGYTDAFAVTEDR